MVDYFEVVSSAVSHINFVLITTALAAGSIFALIYGFRYKLRSSVMILAGSSLAVLSFVVITTVLADYSGDLPKRIQESSLLLSTNRSFVGAAGTAIIVPAILYCLLGRSADALARDILLLTGFAIATSTIAVIAILATYSIEFMEDVIGMVEAGIPRNDFRNPATTASLSLKTALVTAGILATLSLGYITLAVLSFLHDRNKRRLIEGVRHYKICLRALLLSVISVVAWCNAGDSVRAAALSATTGYPAGYASAFSGALGLLSLTVALIAAIWLCVGLLRWHWVLVIASILVGVVLALIIGEMAEDHLLRIAYTIAEQYHGEDPELKRFLAAFSSSSESEFLPLKPLSAILLCTFVGISVCALIQETASGVGDRLIIIGLAGLGVTLFLEYSNLNLTGRVVGSGVVEVRRQFREIPGILENTQASSPIDVLNVTLLVFLHYLLLPMISAAAFWAGMLKKRTLSIRKRTFVILMLLGATVIICYIDPSMVLRFLTVSFPVDPWHYLWLLLVLVAWFGGGVLWKSTSTSCAVRPFVVATLICATIVFFATYFLDVIATGSQAYIQSGHHGGRGSNASKVSTAIVGSSNIFFVSGALTLLFVLIITSLIVFLPTSVSNSSQSDESGNT